MEVHHHHHSEHPAHKIKWSHYFWEFFMLFLAVTLGFLVENQREHYVERLREKQFARQLLADLREDSLFFEKRINQLKNIFPLHEKFKQVMTNSPAPTNYDVINSGLPLLYQFDIQINTAAYSQMKSSGTLRYIRNSDLSIAAQNYYEIQVPRNIGYANESIKYYYDYIEPFLRKHFRFQDVDQIADTLLTKAPVILHRDTDMDQELLNTMETYKFYHLIQLTQYLRPIIAENIGLITRIKKIYQLK